MKLRKEQLGLQPKLDQGGDGVSVPGSPVASAVRNRGGVSALSLQQQLEDARARLAVQEELFLSQPPEEAREAQARLDELDTKLAAKRALHAGLTGSVAEGAEHAAPAPGQDGLRPASPRIRNEAAAAEAAYAEICQLTQQRDAAEAHLRSMLIAHAQAKLASGPKIQQIQAEIGGIEAAMHWCDPAADPLPADVDSAHPRAAAAAGQAKEAPGEHFLQVAARRQEALLQAMGPHVRLLLQAIETRQQRQALEVRLQQLNEAMDMSKRQFAQADALYRTARSAVADAELPLLSSRTRWQRLVDWVSPARRHEHTVHRFRVRAAEMRMKQAGDAVDQARKELGALQKQLYAVHDELQDLHQEDAIDVVPRVMDKRTAAELRGTLGGLLVSLKGLKKQAGSTANNRGMEEFQEMAWSEAAQVQAKIDRIIKDAPQGKLLARWLEWQDRLQDLTEAGSMASKAGRKVARRAALEQAAQAQAAIDRIAAELDLPPTPQEQLLALRGELQDHLGDLQAVARRAESLAAGTEHIERTAALVAQVQLQIDNINAELERRAGTEPRAGPVDRPQA